MRVIAGSAKGRRLKAPKGSSVRPTADRVKEALFNILSNKVYGSLFIDLFAGSGAIGIEALSRGAKHSIFVDNSKENILLISENLEKTGLKERARLIKNSAKDAIGRLNRENVQADLIFLDPPYQFLQTASLVKLITTGPLVKEGGLIIVEHLKTDLSLIDELSADWQKVYGQACLSFITKKQQLV